MVSWWMNRTQCKKFFSFRPWNSRSRIRLWFLLSTLYKSLDDQTHLYSDNKAAQYGFSITTISPGSMSLVATACLPMLPPSSLISIALLHEGYSGLQSSIFGVVLFDSPIFPCWGIFGVFCANWLPLSITASITLMSASSFCFLSNVNFAVSNACRAFLNASAASSCLFKPSKHLARLSSILYSSSCGYPTRKASSASVRP